MRKAIYLAILFALGGSILCESSLYHPSQKAKQDALRHELAVVLKLVQVYVTDKNGNPVTDLKKEDFEIRDNGQTKYITEFERRTISFEKAPPPIQPAVPSVPALQVSRISRKFFFFFDFAFSNMSGIIVSKKAALNFIDTQIRPDDEIGVLSYSANKGLTLHEYLTTDHKKVRQIIQEFSANKYLGRAADIVSDYISTLDNSGGEVGAARREAEKLEEAERRTYNSQVSRFLTEIEELAKVFRYIPGFKNLILFSAGVNNRLLYGTIKPPGKQYMMSDYFIHGDAGLLDRFAKMCEELTGSNCSVFAINGSGLETAHFKDRDQLGDWSLQQMAKETHGKYFDNVSSYEKINEQIQDLTGVYYVLGYAVDEKWDGKFHKIKVAIKRKGCEVYGQGGYFSPKPFSEYSEKEKLLHLIDLALSDSPHLQAAIDFPVLVLPYSVKDKTDLVILAKIPFKKIKEIGGKQMEVISIILNDQNDIVALKRKEINILRYSSEYAFSESRITLPPGRYDCRVVLRNLESGKGARGSDQVIVPDTIKSNLRLLPPLLQKPEEGAVFIEEESKDQKEIHFSDIYPFDQTQYMPLSNELDQTPPKLAAIVRCQAMNIPHPEISFFGSMEDPGLGKKIPLSFSVINRTQKENAWIYSLEFQIEALKPGKYALYFSANENTTKASASVSANLIVK